MHNNTEELRIQKLHSVMKSSSLQISRGLIYCTRGNGCDVVPVFCHFCVLIYMHFICAIFYGYISSGTI